MKWLAYPDLDWQDTETVNELQAVDEFHLLEIDVRCHISEHTLHTHTLHTHILHAYVYDYVHTSPVLDRHLTFSLKALCHISDGIHIINLFMWPTLVITVGGPLRPLPTAHKAHIRPRLPHKAYQPTLSTLVCVYA